MILPDKHLELSNSILTVGSILIKNMKENQTVSYLWSKTQTIPQIKTYDRFLLGLDFLFIIGAVEFKNGFLKRVKK